MKRQNAERRMINEVSHIRKIGAIHIPETKTENRLCENMSAAYVDLTEERRDELNAVLDRTEFFGERYFPAMLSMTGK